MYLPIHAFFSILIGLIFARRKDLAFNKLEQQKDFLVTTYQEISTQLVEALNYREKFLQVLNPEEIALYDTTTAAYIKQAIYRVKDYVRHQLASLA